MFRNMTLVRPAVAGLVGCFVSFAALAQLAAQPAAGRFELGRNLLILAHRRAIVGWYRVALAGLPGVRLNRDAPWASNAYWMVCVEIEGSNAARREKLMANLRARGVDSRPYFHCISDMPMYRRAMTPVAHRTSEIGLNLPSYTDLTREEVDFVCVQLREALADARYS